MKKTYNLLLVKMENVPYTEKYVLHTRISFSLRGGTEVVSKDE